MITSLHIVTETVETKCTSVLSRPDKLMEPRKEAHRQRAAPRAARVPSPALARGRQRWQKVLHQERPHSGLRTKAAQRRAAHPAQRARPPREQMGGTRPAAHEAGGALTLTTARRPSFCKESCTLSTAVYYRFVTFAPKTCQLKH